MNLSLPFKPAVLCIALLSGALSAQAAIGIYSDATTFDSAVTATGTDTLFGVPQDQAGGNPMNRRTLLGTTYQYQISAAGGLIGAGSEDDIWVTANVASDVITFSHFKEGITAFGGNFFGSDFNGQYQAGGVTISVTDATGATFSQTLVAPTVNSFLGFVSSGSSIVSVSLFAQPLASGDSLWPTASNLVLGQAALTPVPEPASLSLLLLGLGGVVLARRRAMH